MDAFFYGTLLHPRILLRVIGNDGAHLQLCPALLLDYTRHQIKHADYPAIVPYARSREIFGGIEIPLNERCVRGTLVRGLTKADIEFLDVFEGDEYTRDTVPVHPLAPFATIRDSESSIAPPTPPPAPDRASLSDPIHAQTYVWCKPLTMLRPDVWSYETFMKVNAHKWVGADSVREEYMILEERRELIGGIVRAVGQHGEVIRE